MNYWDLRNPKTPVFSSGEIQNVLMTCDFLTNDQQIIVTSMEGEIGMFSVKRQKMNFYHPTLPALIEEKTKALQMMNTDSLKDEELENLTQTTSNMLYSCIAVKGIDDLEGQFLIGDEQGVITKYSKEFEQHKKLDAFVGHSQGVRCMEVNKTGTRLISGCMDHSLRLWNYQTCEPLTIFAGHHDSVVSV